MGARSEGDARVATWGSVNSHGGSTHFVAKGVEGLSDSLHSGSLGGLLLLLGLALSSDVLLTNSSELIFVLFLTTKNSSHAVDLVAVDWLLSLLVAVIAAEDASHAVDLVAVDWLLSLLAVIAAEDAAHVVGLVAVDWLLNSMRAVVIAENAAHVVSLVAVDWLLLLSTLVVVLAVVVSTNGEGGCTS